MPSIRVNRKQRADLLAMGAAGLEIDKSPTTARVYARRLHARGTAGVLLASSGDYFVTPGEGLQALRAEAQRPGRSGAV